MTLFERNSFMKVTALTFTVVTAATEYIIIKVLRDSGFDFYKLSGPINDNANELFNSWK